MALGSGALKAAGGIYVARAAMRATVGEAISFEKAWAEVVKKVNDAPNPEAMQQLQRTVAKTAIDLGLPRNGLAEMTAEAGAAGIKFQDLERYVRLAAKASVGWDMSPREAAQSLAEIKSAGQLTIAEMETLGDKINALGDNSAAKERDIVDMFQRAAEGARLAGSSMDTTLAALTALKSGGMQPEVAARFYQAFTSKLRTAGGEGKAAEKINDALKEIGLNGKKVAQDMARDADTTITQILESIGKHADPVKVAKGLMGEEWWDELAKFTGGSLAEFKKQREFLRDPGNFKGSLTKNLDTQLSTTANHLERLKALTGDIGDRLGRWALPGINRGIQAVIQQMDELDRRRALADAETRARGEEPKKGDPIGRATTAAIGAGTWAKDKILDHLVAPLPTQDPSRAIIERRTQEADDERKLADKSREEAKKLEERAKGTKDKTARATLLEQAKRERASATQREARAAEAIRSAGPAGARDMTDVEFGEAAARASIETKRRIALLERGLGAGNQPNVRIPNTGVVMSRQAAEAELLALRKRFEALGGPPAEPQARVPDPASPAAPVMTVPLPPARPGSPTPAAPLPPARPASLTPPAAPVQPEATVQPDATVQPAPTIQPQPTIQPGAVARADVGVPAAQPPASPIAAPAGGGEAAGAVAALQQRIGVLERALAGGSQPNVRIPDTGIVTRRRGVEAEIAELRRRIESQRPAPAAPAPERPATTVPAPAPPAPAPTPRTGAGLGGPTVAPGVVAPKVDPQPALDGMRAVEDGAKRLQTTMGQDLSAPARESMQSYTAALKTGTAEAVAAVTAAVAQMKAALSFTASPTITPRLVAPSGAGAAPAGGAPAARAAVPAAPSSPAPRVQSAALRRGGRGGGGVTVTGPIHVHGVRDVASLHRQISRVADRRARDARDGALHDTGVESA
ncbi:phage tail tape measure protein [uncultured Methylobacterium sp.]|uniref:phage tail tape measure protein n=1 Tax=uncultured Methylobacterium sp. TaxID=157278 RepID=UPI00258AD3D3|nr:phage tail tape measure protein [uncultured Methylobacterium sp.]